MVSFRLGGQDGVSIESTKWGHALQLLGWNVHTVAGVGPVQTKLAGLAMDAPEPPTRRELENALAPFDLVIVENLCSLPLNPAAAAAVAKACAGRPTVLHHHDLAAQRPALAHLGPPPDDPAWAHVTINELSRHQLAEHGITATTLYNRFDPDPPAGDRSRLRRMLGLDDDTRLFLQPTRALARKNVVAGIELAAATGATYWLLGPAEDGYGPELARLVARARCPVVLGISAPNADPDTNPAPSYTMSDVYAACDVVVLPSTWEGFGNPSIESATHRRPLAIGPYPVAAELAAFGFRWFDATDPTQLQAWFDRSADATADAANPVPTLITHNHHIAATHFNLADLPDRLAAILAPLPLPTST